MYSIAIVLILFFIENFTGDILFRSVDCCLLEDVQGAETESCSHRQLSISVIHSRVELLMTAKMSFDLFVRQVELTCHNDARFSRMKLKICLSLCINGLGNCIAPTVGL